MSFSFRSLSEDVEQAPDLSSGFLKSHCTWRIGQAINQEPAMCFLSQVQSWRFSWFTAECFFPPVWLFFLLHPDLNACCLLQTAFDQIDIYFMVENKVRCRL